MEAVHFMNDVEKLRALEAQVMYAEWQDHLATHRSRKEPAGESTTCTREVANVKEENSTPPGPAAPRATRHALRHFIEKVMSDEANKALRADEVNKRRLAFQTAWERWLVWNEEEATETCTSSRSQNISPSCDVNMMKLTSRRNSEYLGLGYGTSVKQYENISYANSDHQPHTEELRKDAQGPAPGVQQNKILGSTDSSSNSAVVAVSNDDNDAISCEEASDLGALTENPQQKEAYWKSHQEVQQRVECTPQGKQATAPQDGIANPSVKSDVRDQDRPHQVRQDQVPLDQEGQQVQPRMGGRVKRDKSPNASSPPLAQESIQDKYADKAIEPSAENIAALPKVKETEQQVQSNLQDKPQQVKGLVDEAFRSSIVVYEQAAKPAAAAEAAVV